MRSKILGGAALLFLAAQVHAAADYPLYKVCPEHGATCSMSGTRTVALGKAGSFVYATKTGAFACSGSAFPSNDFSSSAWCSYGAMVSTSLSCFTSSASSPAVFSTTLLRVAPAHPTVT